MRKPTTPEIRLIALDLDGTLLDPDKRVSPRTERTLRRAAAAGVEIVPASGRYYDAFPEEVRRLDFVRYVIAVNGAEVCDLRTGEVLYAAEIPLETALRIMTYLDTVPVPYDCYMGGRGWMTEAVQKRAEEFAWDAHSLELILRRRTPVPELKAFLRERGRDVQKIQFFTKDPEERPALEAELARRFPEAVLTSSMPNNVEINAPGADKGTALRALADRLGIPRDAVMAFGDAANDLSMIRAAGTGVAMGNADPAVKDAADLVTAGCAEDGVALAVETFCLQEGL